MGRFYFHIRNGDRRYDDRVGAELEDLREAWTYAIRDARRLVDEEVLDGPTAEHWVEIADSTRAVVASLPFDRALALH